MRIPARQRPVLEGLLGIDEEVHEHLVDLIAIDRDRVGPGARASATSIPLLGGRNMGEPEKPGSFACQLGYNSRDHDPPHASSFIAHGTL